MIPGGEEENLLVGLDAEGFQSDRNRNIFMN